MNAPTLPLLDEQTEQELQPPCERPSCERPAEWAIRLKVGCKHVPSLVLCCACHAATFARARSCDLECITCSSLVVVAGIEPL